MVKKVKSKKDGPTKKTTSKKRFDKKAFYAKYPWVVEGSVEEAKVDSITHGIKVAHGRICKVECQETGKIRVINVQDAFQTKFSKAVQKRKQLERANERRKKKGKVNTVKPKKK